MNKFSKELIETIAALYSGEAMKGDPTEIRITGHIVWLAQQAQKASKASTYKLNREKQYGLCRETGRVIYRDREQDFGNGLVDTDEAPIWQDDVRPFDSRGPSEGELLLLPEVDRNAPHDPSQNFSNVLGRIRERTLDAEVLLLALADPKTYQHSDSREVLITAMAEKALDYQSAATEAMELLADDPEPWRK